MVYKHQLTSKHRLVDNTRASEQHGVAGHDAAVGRQHQHVAGHEAAGAHHALLAPDARRPQHCHCVRARRTRHVVQVDAHLFEENYPFLYKLVKYTSSSSILTAQSLIKSPPGLPFNTREIHHDG